MRSGDGKGRTGPQDTEDRCDSLALLWRETEVGGGLEQKGDMI